MSDKHKKHTETFCIKNDNTFAYVSCIYFQSVDNVSFYGFLKFAIFSKFLGISLDQKMKYG